MPNVKQLAGFTPSATTTAHNAGSTSSTLAHPLREVVVNSSALTPVVQSRINDEGSQSEFLVRALGGLFIGTMFNNSPVNISINLQSNVNPNGSNSSYVW